MKINYSMFEKLIEFQIENGTDALIICGTTGEKSTLTYDEHIELIRSSVVISGGRIPVIAGTGSNDISHALKISNDAEKCGVDGLLMVTPYYNKCSQDGLIESFRYIEKNVSTDIILYNVPSRTGFDIKAQTYKELSKLKRINGAKEAGGNISALVKALELCGDELNFYSGNDDQITPFISLGAKGVISVLSNVAPTVAAEIAHSALKKDYETSSRLQIEYNDLCSALFCDVNPIPVKEALCMMGFDVGRGRLPLSPLNQTNRSIVEKALKKHALI